MPERCKAIDEAAEEAVDFDFEEGILDLAPELPSSRQRQAIGLVLIYPFSQE